MRPSALIGATVRWLLKLTWEGRVYRLAERPVDAPTGDAGAMEPYEAGLLIGDFGDAAEFWSDDSAPRSLPMSVVLPDAVARISDGCDLQTATGKLYQWADGGDERDLLLLLDGVVLEPEHEEEGQPIAFTLEEEEVEAAGLIPPEDARYTAETWPGGTGDVDTYDERYPIIIGRPGVDGEEGSPSLTVSSARLLIAGHKVAASTVNIYDEENGTSDTGVAVVHQADNLGRVCATATSFTNIGSPAGTLVVGDAYWIGWPNDGGLTRRGAEVRGGGQLLRAMLQLAEVRYDAGRLEAAVPALDLYAFDAPITVSPEAQLRPLDWVRDHMLPYLPMSLRLGPDGLYPLVWRWWATEAEAEIDVDGSRAWRDGPVRYSDRSEIANEHILRFGRNARTERYTLRAGVTGDAETSDSDLVVSQWCQVSRLRYGHRPAEAQTSDSISDAATAARVLTWWARRYALPLRSARWVIDTRRQWLAPGMVVDVVDTAVAVDGLGLVQDVQRTSSSTAAVEVAILPRVEGEP